MRRSLIAACAMVLLAHAFVAAQAQTPSSSAAPAETSQDEAASDQPPTYAETVVVTASRVEESILDAPVAMTVVGPEQVASSPAASVAELLQGVGGLNVIQLNAREFQIAGRQASGVLGQGQLVLLDGRPVNNGNSGMFWDQLPIDLDDVDRIEILHGPASMVWGANAMSAVINIRTKAPRDVQGLRLTTGVGERGVAFGSLRFAGAKDKASYRLSGGYYRADGWERPTTFPDGSPMTGYLVYSNPWVSQPKADVRVDYDLGDRRMLTVHGGYAGSSGMSFSGDLPLEFLRGFSSGFADVSYSAPSMDARISWGRSGGKYRSLTDSSIHSVSSTYPTAELNLRRAVGTHQLLVAGLSGRLDSWHLEVVPRRTSRHEAGGYVEDQIFLGQRVRLNVGGRFDWIQFSGPSASPRASLLFKPAAGQSVHVAVSRGYRVPTPIENFVDFTAAYPLDAIPGYLVPYTVVGNDELHETPNVGIEAGYTGELSRRHAVQATVYRSTTSGLIQSAPVGFYSPEQPPPGWPFPAAFVPRLALPSTFSYINTGTLRNQGVELTMNSRWPRSIWTSLAYTFQATPRLTDVNPAAQIPVNRPPRHQASGVLGWSVAPWRGSIGVNYAARAFWADVFPADPRLTGYSGSYTMVNASAAYRLPRKPVELVVDATNMFDRKIQQHVYGDVIRRSVVASVRIDVTQ
jgi:outer membrane receptor protein involved in Fe transport